MGAAREGSVGDPRPSAAARAGYLRAAAWVVAVAAVLFIGLPVAFLGGLYLWKREVRFGPDHWRHWYHVQGTPLARFPIVTPVGAPVFTQRITSGYGTYLGVAYATALPERSLLLAIAEGCSGLPAAQAPIVSMAAPASTDRSYMCNDVVFRLTPTGAVTKVDAYVSD